MKTTKTIEAWYEHLPEPIRSEALSARKRALNRYGVNRYAYSLAEALLEGFGWRVDGGNSKKWSSIHTQAMNGEFDKPDTAPTAPSADEIQDLRKRIEELERYICEHKQHATMDRHGLIAVVARRIADEHRKHGKTLAEGDEWASIAAAKIIGTLSELGVINPPNQDKASGKPLSPVNEKK